MLARLQRGIVASLLLAALAWAVCAWHAPRSVFWGGLALFVTGHALFLALEFTLMHAVNRHADAPRASVGSVARAWLSESLHAPRVFGWRQPFRAHAWPDQLAPTPGAAGVVFVHGFFCNRAFWHPWLQRLARDGRVYAAVSLEPVFGSIDAYAATVDAAVRRVHAATGVPVLLVCHSMGGLAVRAWLRQTGADARVAHVVTIGTPHQGTWLGRYGRTANARQMRLDSAWLRELAQSESAEHRRRFTCYHSNADNIVFPTPVATLPDADNRFLPGVAHVAMAFDERVMDETLARLQGGREPVTGSR